MKIDKLFSSELTTRQTFKCQKKGSLGVSEKGQKKFSFQFFNKFLFWFQESNPDFDMWGMCSTMKP